MPFLNNLNNAPWHGPPGTRDTWLTATALVAIALALCAALDATFPALRFSTLLLAVIATLMICGIRAGIFSLIITAAFAWYFILQPTLAPRWQNAGQVGALLLFVVYVSSILVLLGSVRATIERSRHVMRMLNATCEIHPDGVLLIDARGSVTNANQPAIEIFGQSRESLTGVQFESLFPEHLRARLAQTRSADTSRSDIERLTKMPGLAIQRRDGTEVPVDIRYQPIEAGGSVSAIVTVHEMTRKITESKLYAADRQQNATGGEPSHTPEEMRVWADAFTHAAVGLTITDPITRSLRFVNKAWAEMHGWTADEVLGMPTSMFFPEEEQPRLATLYAEADRTGHVTFEARRRRKDGSTFLAAFDVVTVHDTDGRLLYRVASSRDITESRRAEELLRHATKMEAIGALTGGMAHDFNNLLGAIILSLDFVQREMADTDHLKRFVVEAKTAAESGAELISSLLAFARRQSLNPSRIDVNDQVRGMYRLLSRVLGEEIGIELACAPDVWPVTADSSQLEACIMNLATNARDAMPNGGTLRITTGNQRLDSDYARLNPSVTPGEYAMISVSDTGTGMTQEVVAHIFEPFFSTKDVGKGTGLGLSMVLGFAMQSGGHVSVYSEPGVGTTIRLFLPRARSGTDPVPAEKEMVSGTPVKGGGEAVLVVEDNAAMRQVVTHQLAQLNYVVTDVDSASAALAMLEAKSIDLLFSDVVMPGGMDGFELAERVRARWPAVKVLLTSGFSGDRVNRRFAGSPSPPHLLGKPYDLPELARAVREALTA
jgi:PAS domain S-box-containing protein